LSHCFWGHFFPAATIHGQTGTYYPPVAKDYYEIADIACPTGLNTRFNDYQPVKHDGQEFWSEWMSESRAHPLPSKNWYKATPSSTLVSINNAIRWYDARILVHCFTTRNMYGITFHYHQIGSTGRTEIIQCRNGDSRLIVAEPYDPYNPDYGGGSGEDCSDGGGASGGGGTGGGGSGSGGSSCVREYVYIEVSYDEGKTWHVIWEGYADVCE
jgi:hypothetical protein